MKHIKRVLGITFLLAAIVGCLIFHVSAAEVVASGYCGGEGDGTNLSWSLDNQGTLTINGNGAMASYKSFYPPWKSKLSSIRALIIGDGVTSIGHSAFRNAFYLDSISIGNSVASIGAYAFYEVYGGNHTGHRYSVIMPSSVQLIAENAFPYVECIYFEGNAPEIMNNAFNESATIYYVSGLTGWTDSQAYDINNDTWNGYKLVIWEKTPEDVFPAGDGTLAAPYQIQTPEQLSFIRNDLSAHYELISDIDLSNIEKWEKIGSKNERFSGSLNGNNHTITGMHIVDKYGTSMSSNYVGLFAFIDNAVIQNINFSHVDIEVYAGYVGCIAGSAIDSTITNCGVEGIVYGIGNYGNAIGGLVGNKSGGMIISCRFSGRVEGCSAGGITANNSGLIEYCSVSSNFAESYIFAYFPGGIAGSNTGTIRYCSNSNEVWGNRYYSGGGAGGIVGSNAGIIERCYNTGYIHFATVYGGNVGGICGSNSKTVSNCYNEGLITSDDNFVCGITSNGTIENCYNVGLLNGSTNYGISKSGSATNCYYIDNVPVSDSGTMKTATELQQKSTFIGYDFENIWMFTPDSPYPKLLYNLKNIQSVSTTLSFTKTEYTGSVGAEIFLWTNLVSENKITEELEKTITWHSSNEEVFPIDMNNTCFLPYGSVTAETFISGTPKAPGTAIVTVTIGGVSASCKVTVTAAGEMTLSMSDADEVYSIASGSRGYLYADITAYDGSSTAKWTTSNKDIVAFSTSGAAYEDGLIAMKSVGGTDAETSVNFYARSAGTATITCTMSNGLTSSRQIKVLSAEQVEKEPNVEKNPYNVPHYSDPPDERVEKYLNQYQGEWYEAYTNYLASLKEAIAKKEKENLGNSLSISIEEQAKIMMETDESAGTSYLTFSADLSGKMIPEEWKIYAYQALCEMLTDCAGNKLDFSNIDLSDEFKANSSIVKEISSKVNKYAGSFNYGNVTVEVSALSASEAMFGRMICSGTVKGRLRNFTVTICSDTKTNNQVIADYLNELRDLSVKSLYNIYDALAKDFLGDTVVGFSEKYFKDKLSRSKLIKTMTKLEGHFSEMGLGGASTLLISGSEYYSKATALCDKVLNNKNYDITRDLNALASINIEDNTITDTIVDKCAKKLAKATEKLEAALREYLASGTIKEWNDDAWDFVKNIFNCPVSVTVYNSAGEIVGYAGEDDMWHTDNIRIEEKGEGKIVYTPAGQEYSFKVTGTGHGAVNCTVEQWKDGEPVGRSNYYDIPVDVGTELTTTLSANVADIITPVFISEGVDFEADEYIPVTANGRVTVNAEAGNEEHGRVMGDGLYTRGDTVVLCAIPEDGYHFCGWYTENDELVTVSTSFSFAAREDVSYTAHFVEIIPSLENYMVEISESYADVYDVEITQEGESFTLCLQRLDSSADMSELVALFAEFTADGKMTSTHALNGKAREEGVEFVGMITGDYCKLFLLDGNYVPVMEACVGF